MAVLGRIKSGLVYVLGAIVVVVLAPVWIPWVVLVLTKESWARRLFLKKHEGMIWFCYSTRRHWRELIVNNVLPVLPEHVTAVQTRGRRPNPRDPVAYRLSGLASRLFREHRLPFFVRVCSRKAAGIPLHENLRALKANGAVDHLVRDQVRAILSRVLQERQPDK